MRSALSAALITLAVALVLAPFAVSADHTHKTQPAPATSDRHHHETGAHSHNHNATHNHGGQGQARGHSILQRLHNLFFGRYHRTGTCASAHNAPGHTHDHAGHSGEAHGSTHLGTPPTR